MIRAEIGKIIAGALAWFLIVTVLRLSCVFDVSTIVDGLWLRDLHGDLTQNLAGEVVYRVPGYNCGASAYLYGALDADDTYKSLTSLVDIDTWKEVEPYTHATITYADAKHKYVFYSNSDGNYMRVSDK